MSAPTVERQAAAVAGELRDLARWTRDGTLPGRTLAAQAYLSHAAALVVAAGPAVSPVLAHDLVRDLVLLSLRGWLGEVTSAGRFLEPERTARNLEHFAALLDGDTGHTPPAR